MSYKTIELSRDENIVTVALNKPDIHNAMDETMMKELTSCFNELANDNTVGIIIFTGNGKSFSAGADLNWMKSMASYSKEENIQDSKLLLDLYESIYNCPKPVIGKINGHAFGGGIGLIAVCDLTIAPPGLKFAFSEVKLGIIPSVISTFVGKRIGVANMRRLFITGERFTTEHAEKIGLIDFMVDQDELDGKINEYVDIIQSSGPIAIKEVKNLIGKYETLDIEKYKEFTVEKIAELRVSKEGREGIKAFLEKRKPKWKG